MTQEKLAEALDMTKASISRIEGLKQGYTQDFLEACADALGTHPGTLLMRGPTPADLPPEELSRSSTYTQPPRAYGFAERETAYAARRNPAPAKKRKRS